jgi:serine/threonine-protein kinase
VADDPAYLQRFAEEARSASLLNHPNIVTIYGVGGHDEAAYIAMELVQGRTLSDLIAHARPDRDRALDIAVQLADALAAAHEAGIVHRDLKPDNVMVTPSGLVKVLDFGIAKRRGITTDDASRGQPGADTAGGAIVGTVGYMSPEQACGRPADHRADQFSFGVMFCELLSGHRAFAHATPSATLAAIVDDEPAGLSEALADSAPALRAIVARCLAKSPDDRFAETRTIATALRACQDAERRERAGGAPTRRRVLAIGASAAAGLAGLSAWQFWPTRPRFTAVAVLAFANRAHDPDAAFLCEGLTRVLVERLWRLQPLRVVPAGAVLTERGRALDAAAAGRAFDVDAVVQGGVTRTGERLLIEAELVAVPRGTVQWRRTYERRLADLVLVQQEITREIARAIGVEVGADEERQLDRGGTGDPEAAALYLRGLHAHELGTEDGYLAARDLLGRAVARDARFTRALVALGSTYSASTLDGFERPLDAWMAARRCVLRALWSDPELPDAHAESASIAFLFDWDWEASGHEFAAALASRAGEINPDLLISAALRLWALGRVADALAFVGQARRLDPLSVDYLNKDADLRVQRGDLDAAQASYEQAMTVAPDDPRAPFGLAEVERRRQRFDAAIVLLTDALERAGATEDPRIRTALSDARGATGYRAVEQALAYSQIDAMEARAATGAYVSPLDRAREHARLGARETAFPLLADAIAERAPGLVFLGVDPVWDVMRDDPRFAAAVARVGL